MYIDMRIVAIVLLQLLVLYVLFVLLFVPLTNVANYFAIQRDSMSTCSVAKALFGLAKTLFGVDGDSGGGAK